MLAFSSFSEAGVGQVSIRIFADINSLPLTSILRVPHLSKLWPELRNAELRQSRAQLTTLAGRETSMLGQTAASRPSRARITLDEPGTLDFEALKSQAALRS